MYMYICILHIYRWVYSTVSYLVSYGFMYVYICTLYIYRWVYSTISYPVSYGFMYMYICTPYMYSGYVLLQVTQYHMASCICSHVQYICSGEWVYKYYEVLILDS